MSAAALKGEIDVYNFWQTALLPARCVSIP
jgi:hypothetical protein